MIALAFCVGAAVLVWIRPWLGGVSWSRLAAVFVAVDVGLMGFTSQLTQTPPNDLVAGTTPVEKLMAAKLPPGGRLVNYDPQTYSSYPDSPQGVPDLNIIPGLPSVSGYASIVNGNYETTTHTHEQDDLDIGQLSSGTLGRLDLREVVTVPEYFLVPSAVDAALLRRFHADLRGLRRRSRPGPWVRRRFQRHGVPLRPGAAAGPRRGEDGLLVLRGDARARYARPSFSATRQARGRVVRFGALMADGTTRWGAPVSVSCGRQHGDRSASGWRRDRVVGPGAGGLVPAQRAVVSVAGHPYELAGSLSSALVPGPWQLAGFSQGYAVFTLRKPAEPIAASTANGRRLPVQVVSSTTKSEQIRLHAPAPSTVIRSVAWDSGWSATVSVNGGKAQKIARQRLRPRPAGPHPAGNDLVTFHYRPRHLLLAAILSLGAIAFLLALLGVWLVRRRRPRSESDDPAVEAGWHRMGAGGGAGARGLSRPRQALNRSGGRGSGGILRLPPPTSPRPRSQPPRAHARLVPA